MKRAEDFARACKKAGLQQAGCGIGVRDLLQQLRQGPLTCGRSRAGVSMPHAAAMGPAVRAGLARYHAAERCFVISPAGETWLDELEVHGLEGKAEGGRRKAEGKLHCFLPGCIIASLPEIEPHWQAWFWLGALFGFGAYLLTRVWFSYQALEGEFGEERLNGPLNGDGLRERLHARVLTELEHREMLLQCHASAMLHPLTRVDIRGVPVLWGLSEEQRERFLSYAHGALVEWEGGQWRTWVTEDAGFRFITFIDITSRREPALAPSIKPRKETAKIIVARGRASRS